jgi:putative transposase
MAMAAWLPDMKASRAAATSCGPAFPAWPATASAAAGASSLLQKNVLDRQRWTTRDELRIAITVWIERTYHRRRRQRALGRLTPIEYEILATAAQAA